MQKKQLEKDNIEKGCLVWKKVIPLFKNNPLFYQSLPFLWEKFRKIKLPSSVKEGFQLWI